MKRFYETASTTPHDHGWQILLDGRPVRSPGRKTLILPNQALADALAAEWQQQEEIIQPQSMPMTRMANSALDQVAGKRDAIVQILVDYGGSDLVCYRADQPERLRTIQDQAWDPYCDWFMHAFGCALKVTAGITPIEQDMQLPERLRDWLGGCDDWQLAAMHDLVTLAGSFVIAAAVYETAFDAEDAWQAACVDDFYQFREWGEDPQAVARLKDRRRDFLDAVAFLRLLETDETE